MSKEVNVLKKLNNLSPKTINRIYKYQIKFYNHVINYPDKYGCGAYEMAVMFLMSYWNEQKTDKRIKDLTKRVYRLQNKFIVHNYVDKRGKHEND